MFLVAQTGFLLLTILCLLAIDRTFFPAHLENEQKRKYRKRFWMGILIWLSIVSILSLAGFFSNFSTVPPRLFILLIVPLVTFLFIYFNKSFTAYLDEIPAHQIILLQSFRIPVELLLWLLFIDGKLPVQMTFEQCNLDVLTGLTAPVVAYWIYRKPELLKTLGIIWNVAGILLLINIVSIAIMSTPTPLRVFMNEPANRVVALFPIVYLPAFLVPMAYYLHWFSLKKISRKKKGL